MKDIIKEMNYYSIFLAFWSNLCDTSKILSSENLKL